MSIKKLSLALALPLSLIATAASAQDSSFAGNLSSPNDALFFNFLVTSSSNVTLRTYSYAGGTNAQGTVIARGGFDPILALFNATTGTLIDQNDDGGLNVSADAVTGARYDTFLQALLGPGNYTVSVSAYSNFAGATLSSPFTGSGGFNGRDSHWAFDVLGASAVTGPGAVGAVPEPGTWAMMLFGFGAIGWAMRRRRRVSVRFQTA